ncbi:formin-binding protein 1-like isoform X1 [Takifugu rubripes]|uniref:formin-binding protein 1-like isoform X1 n=1 Tax=Takifugu rubripes TaxID=31033 RepID=UPI0005D287B0|nr:formin-binding protein 1-like isoform X1 [Takifugu rubripes]|eukprot:XP_011616959.1 PREDICTED: formin-binding protein 1-like isoform X1 [Takifugu rubripes]
MSWGTELWDQFDSLDKHTQWGIDFLERYAKFVKERLEIEQNYAKQLRGLVKKYCPKRSKDEEPRFTSCLSFYSILNELNDYAGQRELVAEEMAHKVYGELMKYSQDLKAERKHHLQEGRKAQQYLDQCWKQMDNSKKKFERECKEAEKSQITFERLDNDINATKSDVERAKNQLYARTHAADESKNEYASQLQNFNAEQWKHFNNAIPHIFKNVQAMDERRTVKLGETYQSFAEAERRVIPIISKCLDGMIVAAKAVDERRDSAIVVESFKSGFDPPGDYPFEDFSQNLSRTGSDGTISNTPKGDREKDGGPGPRPDPKHPMSRTKNKLWLFGKKPKSPSSAPPPPPSSSSSSFLSSRFSSEKVSHYLSEIKTTVPRIPQNLRALKRGAPSLEDFSHLPPEQRRKRLQQRIDELHKELQKEMDQRDALNKMKDVYEKNPQMGDPSSLQPKISETICNMEKLRSEIHKNETWLSEVEGKQSSRDRRHSADNHHRTPQGRESPEGSHTDDTGQEHHTPHRHAKPPQPGNPNSDPHEFDDEFDDDDPLPVIGHCKALYGFDGQNEGTLSMAEDEVLYIIEEDKGDGWTRARKQNGVEGYVPTSYVDITLEKSSKGAVTYI